jgi:kinetochore protein Mis13/DSN1
MQRPRRERLVSHVNLRLCRVAGIAPNFQLTRFALDYDEEDNGFLFTRAKTRKVRTSTSKSAQISAAAAAASIAEPHSNPQHGSEASNSTGDVVEPPQKKKRSKMSFSTPNVREEKPVRRSKRLSDEHDRREGSPQRRARKKETGEPASAATISREMIHRPSARDKTPTVTTNVTEGEDHSATRIALPFADTPVIRRNKAMREGKVGKGERRSSLGLRGRRASSLIDSGNSNGK